jgi:hypothetical protein
MRRKIMGLTNIVIFAISAGVGYLLGHYLPAPWGTYASILISYHIFLGWCVFSADHEKGFSLPIGETILTHLACLMVVVGLGIGRNYIPFFGLIRYCIPALAPFECTWLFSGGRTNKEVPLTAEAVATAAENAAAADAATASDYDEWLHHVARQKPPFPKPGSSLKVEYERWLVARARSRTAVALNNPQL